MISSFPKVSEIKLWVMDDILDLRLRHKEQISLLAKVQNSLLVEQSVLIDLGYDACPNCGQKISKNGFI